MLSDLKQMKTTAHAVLSSIQVIYKVCSFSVSNVDNMTDRFLQYLKTQKELYEAMKSLANSIKALSGQLSRLKEVPISEQLCTTIREFPVIMDEVVNFIRRWLKSWMCMYQSPECIRD